METSPSSIDRLGKSSVLELGPSIPSSCRADCSLKYIAEGAITSACSSTQLRFSGQIPVALNPEIQLEADAPVTQAL